MSRRSKTSPAVGALLSATVVVTALGFGGGTAGAVTSGDYTFARTVDNASPVAGETVTFTLTVTRASIVDGYLNTLRETHPACFEFVPGSATVAGRRLALEAPANPVPTVTATAVEVTDTGWRLNRNTNLTLTTKYVVNCDPGEYVPGLVAKGTLLSGLQADFPALGPAITVSQPGNGTDPGADPGTEPGTDPDPGTHPGGDESPAGGSGSLGDLFAVGSGS